MSGKFEIFKGKNGEFYFRLKAGNGEPILSSEGYKTKASAKNGISSVGKNCAERKNYERRTTSDGRFYFVLKARNHQIIGQSQFYKSDSGCENGIESVQKNGVTSKVVDLTLENA